MDARSDTATAEQSDIRAKPGGWLARHMRLPAINRRR